MPPSNSEQSIFLAALELKTPAERIAYLKSVCAGDQQLFASVEALLAAHDQSDDYLERPPVDPTFAYRPITEGPGTVIGPYKLLQHIGEGGFGIVYMAEQQEPVRRMVALKIIKPGMDTKEVIARFESERQALALMDHPNISRVLDAGATESGRPYFVMELVKGVPMTEYCDKNNMATEGRLALFITVCHAVQHAHQKGIIHRDIKPSNVMVTLHDGHPVPKVIDFGVAKATSQRLTERTLFTAFGQMVGTPAYMSPEQAEMSGLDIDTRSDIYSLGVLLYELLTGSTPFDSRRLREAGYMEMQRIIREEEPPRPSTRISTLGEKLTVLSNHRGTDGKKLGQLLRGDLDLIVMKALEKERGRRYDTPNSFADDVKRFLSHEPVVARAPSTFYRLRKFTQRNKTAVMAGSSVAAALIMATVLSTALAIVASQARNEAITLSNSERAARQDADDKRGAIERQNKEIATLNTSLQGQKEELRDTLYAAEMNLVQVAAEGKQYLRAVQLLDQQRPAAGQSDLRGFEWHYWQRKLQRGRLRSLEIPQLASMRVGSRMFSRDATRLAAVGYRLGLPSEAGHDLLAVFDGVTGRELFAPFDPFPDLQPAATYSFPPLAMSEDGARLAVAVHNRGSCHISVRDGGSGSEIHRIEFPGNLSDIELTADGSRIAVAFYDLEEPKDSRIGVKVWDTSTGDLVQSLPMLPYFRKVPLSPNYRILWSPDGTRLLRQSLSREATDDRPEFHAVFQIVDVASGGELWQREMPSCKNPQCARSWSPDGKLLVIFEAAEPGIAVKPNVQLWDSGTGTTLAILDRETPGMSFESAIDFSSDGKRLADVVGYNEICVWEVPELPLAAGASPLRIAAPNLTLQTSGKVIQALAFSADGRELNSVDSGTSILTWDATAREETGIGPDSTKGPFNAAISVDATKIALQEDSSRQMCSVWDLVKNQEVCRLKINAGMDVFLRSGGISPDGRRVAIVSNSTLPEGESQIVIHDAQTGEVLKVIRVDKLDSSFPASIVNIEFRPDGRQIAALIGTRSSVQNQGPEQLVAWDAASGMKVFSVATELSRSRALWYSFDGTSLMVAGEEAAVFYDAITGERQRSVSLPSSSGPCFFNLRHQMFGTSVGSDFVLVDLATGQERLRLRRYNFVVGMAISPDGSRLVLSQRLLGGSEVTFWSLKSGRRLLAFSLPEGGLTNRC